MAQRRFRIFGKGADEGDGGPGQAEPTAETRRSPRARASGPDAGDWTLGEDSPGPAAPASAPEEGAEALVPRELRANGASQSPPPAPAASEWLLGGDETPRRRSTTSPVVEREAERAQRSDEADLTSIAAMAAEAENLAADSKDPAPSEPVLEPPSWVAAGPTPQARSDPEPEGETKSGRETKHEPETKPEPEPQRRSPATAEPDEAAENRVSLSRAEFDELRELGMSVTQAKRVIRYRDERNGFRTLDELDQVPGFPRSFLSGVKERVVP
jgi:DNA uptake protein ComE-like DNA-binding protein